MKTNKTYLAATLTIAQRLQARYNQLKSPSTQRVRNPFPMHELVKEALPTLPNYDKIYEIPVQAAVTIDGKRFMVTHTILKTRSEITGEDEIQTKGMTKEEIKTTLEKEGFRATLGGISGAVPLDHRHLNPGAHELR